MWLHRAAVHDVTDLDSPLGEMPADQDSAMTLDGVNGNRNP
jgi:hypothetical protein